MGEGIAKSMRNFGPWGAFIIVFITVASYYVFAKIDRSGNKMNQVTRSDVRLRIIHVEDEVGFIKENLKEMKTDIKEDLKEMKRDLKGNTAKLIEIESDIRNISRRGSDKR